MLNIELLTEMNHWWKLEKVKEQFALPYKRRLFKEILEHLGLRQIIGIIGLRRVGKTTLFYQLIDILIKNGTDPKNIIYFSFDETKTKLEDVFRLYQEKIVKRKIGNEKTYVFVDEIQKLDDWQNKIKIYYDLYPNMKFFISGSASLNILLRAKETLAGRIFYFYLDLLSFEEFLEMKGKNVEKMKENLELWKKELRIEMNNYMLRPLPEIVDKSDEIAKKYIKESIVEKIILKDITDLFEIREIEAIEKIIYTIASEPGLVINLSDMSKDFGISRQSISNYLYYLQTSFLIRKLRNFRGSFKSSSRKLKKYYLLHPCFALALASPETGKIAENLVAFKTKADYYWRDRKKEVDFILENKEILPIEVKYKKKVRERETKNLLKFMEKFKAKKSLMVTEDYESEIKIEKKKVNFIPLWKWLFGT